MRVRSSLRRSITALVGAAAVTAGAAVATPAQAAIIYAGPYSSLSTCESVRFAYEKGGAIKTEFWCFKHEGKWYFGYSIR
ncbi:hypothetical protein [Cellulomonas sp.]|uniref:hypothetical protein n=1 Tax=Cellulomonas sp. TaxID=40001 RepID=UPI001B00FB6F|nr:hypothetical protein [Cellulomonas sp.]MBO9554270.1 hypothetical protein [Cellulomonas sp.]